MSSRYTNPKKELLMRHFFLIAVLAALTLVAIPVMAQEAAHVTTVINVINDDGGTATPNDFLTFIAGRRIGSGETLQVSPGTHVVRAFDRLGYARVTIDGDCAPNGTVTVASGDHAVCRVVYDDLSPEILQSQEVWRLVVRNGLVRFVTYERGAGPVFRLRDLRITEILADGRTAPRAVSELADAMSVSSTSKELEVWLHSHPSSWSVTMEYFDREEVGLRTFHLSIP